MLTFTNPTYRGLLAFSFSLSIPFMASACGDDSAQSANSSSGADPATESDTGAVTDPGPTGSPEDTGTSTGAGTSAGADTDTDTGPGADTDPSADTDTDTDTGSGFDAPPPASIFGAGMVEVITEDAVRYHVLSAAGYTVTAVESETETIVVDLGPEDIPNYGQQAREYLDAVGKPLSVIISHAHADHYGNIAEFSDVDIYAHTAIAPLLLADASFADALPRPLTEVDSSQTMGGLAFEFAIESGTETVENSYIYLEEQGALFASDLAYSRHHNYIREYTPLDGTDELLHWIDVLGVLRTDFGDYAHVFVGHGGTRNDVATTIDENLEYLQIAQGLITGTQLLESGVAATTNQEVVDELAVRFPDHALGGLNFALPDAFFPGDPGANWFE